MEVKGWWAGLKGVFIAVVGLNGINFSEATTACARGNGLKNRICHNFYSCTSFSFLFKSQGGRSRKYILE
jgi:hypothetical protein